MPTNILLTEEEKIKFEEGGGLKPETLYYRKEMLSPFICFMLIIVMLIKLKTFTANNTEFRGSTFYV